MNDKVQKTCFMFLEYLFGRNILFITKFEFLEVSQKVTLEPEYYYTDGYKFFDFWYNPEQNWVEQLAEAIADFYVNITNSTESFLVVKSRLLRRFPNEVRGFNRKES